LKNTANSR